MNTARANITAPKAAVARGTPTGAAATLQSVTSEWVDLDWAGRRVRIEHQWLRREDQAAPLMVFLREGLGSVSMWRDFPMQLCAALGCRGLVYLRPGNGQSQRIRNLFFGKSGPLHHFSFQPCRAHREATLPLILNCP